MKTHLVLVAVLVGLLALGVPGVTLPHYTVTDLGALSIYTSHAYGLNNHGQVVGESEVIGGASGFLWEKGTMTALGVGSSATAINDKGKIVGVFINADGRDHGFVWDKSRGMQDIGIPLPLVSPPTAFSRLQAINDPGTTAGMLGGSPILWRNGWWRAPQTLGGQQGTAYGINNSGQVVGSSTNAAGDGRAFLWKAGMIKDLGTLPEIPGHKYETCAYAINDRGWVVGVSNVRAFLWRNGVMRDLGTLGSPPPGSQSYAFSINNLGQVVGGSGSSAFLWQPDTGMVNLNSLIDPASGWRLEEARGINDHGQITGTGRSPTGWDHAFLLTPKCVR